MPPVPATKINNAVNTLWQRFLNDETLLPLDRLRFQKEAQVLEQAEPEGALFIRAILAAFEDDADTVCALADTVLTKTASEVLYNNLTMLLIQLGKMQKAYALCRVGLTNFPISADLLNITIGLAQAFEDTVVLEESLLAWQKLFPREPHPSVFMFAKNQQLTALDAKADDALEEALCAFLDTLPMEESEPVSKRQKRLAAALLDGVEP